MASPLRCSVCTKTSILLQVTSDEPLACSRAHAPSRSTEGLARTGAAGRSGLLKATIAHQRVCARTPPTSVMWRCLPVAWAGVPGSHHPESTRLIKDKLTSSGATETPAIWIRGRKPQICGWLPKDDHRWVHFCCLHRYLGINLVAGDSEALSQLWIWQWRIRAGEHDVGLQKKPRLW